MQRFLLKKLLLPSFASAVLFCAFFTSTVASLGCDCSIDLYKVIMIVACLFAILFSRMVWSPMLSCAGIGCLSGLHRIKRRVGSDFRATQNKEIQQPALWGHSDLCQRNHWGRFEQPNVTPRWPVQPTPPRPGSAHSKMPLFCFPLPSLTPHSSLPQTHLLRGWIWHREPSVCPRASLACSKGGTNTLHSMFLTLLGWYQGLNASRAPC